VHLGEHDLPVLAARRVVGSSRIVGRTAHTIEEARAAVHDAADYLGVGPCFPSDTKSFDTFAPREFLAAVSRNVALPAFAIGGILPERIAELRAIGLTRVAVASAVTRSSDPVAAVRAILAALADSR
jgi:thiamine-phosphate pyrophosphorylase